MWLQKIKTALLLAGLSSLLLLLGHLFGGITGLYIALFVALLMNGWAYFFSDTLVLRMYHAQPLDKQQYGWIYEMVDELSHTMKIPRPQLWLITTPMANAFATGRSPSHASVAVTSGILDLLDRHELRGVLAHELAHIQNQDILITTIAATIATSISYLAHMLQYGAVYGTASKRRDNPFVLLLVAIIMPIAATLLQLAVSRSREYLADHTGAHACHDPLALASALKKLHQHIPHANLDGQHTSQASTGSLFIVHPFTAQGFVALFSTHPPMQHRIERLHKLHEKMF